MNGIFIPNAKWFEKIQALHSREDGEFGWRTPTKPLRFEFSRFANIAAISWGVKPYALKCRRY